MSFLEIYNEQVKDLLSEQQFKDFGGQAASLRILEDPQRGVFVQDLEEYEVFTVQELENIVKFGNSRRAVASTAANQTSSRSHAILIFNVVT